MNQSSPPPRKNASIAGSALPARGGAASTAIPPATRHPLPALELQLKPDPTIYDGRFANLGWLQELPKPQTKITWDNVLLVSPKTASARGKQASIFISSNLSTRAICCGS